MHKIISHTWKFEFLIYFSYCLIQNITVINENRGFIHKNSTFGLYFCKNSHIYINSEKNTLLVKKTQTVSNLLPHSWNNFFMATFIYWKIKKIIAASISALNGLPSFFYGAFMPQNPKNGHFSTKKMAKNGLKWPKFPFFFAWILCCHA